VDLAVRAAPLWHGIAARAAIPGHGENMTTMPALHRPLNISIGSVPLSLSFSESTLFEKARSRYREFAANSGSALPIQLRSDLPAPIQSSFSYAHDRARLYLGDSGAEFHGVRHEYALDSLLRILLTMVLLPERGFLLHAASVVRDGRAYIFMGRSGAGKSTVASLSPQGSVLTDEISLLRFVDGAWQAHGTPFWGEFRAAGINRHFPIAGIYQLVQAPIDSVEPLSPKEILRALLPCVLFFSSDSHASEVLLRTLLAVATQIPCRRLRFRRGLDFWRVIAP
jgi:hypothetical protein